MFLLPVMMTTTTMMIIMSSIKPHSHCARIRNARIRAQCECGFKVINTVTVSMRISQAYTLVDRTELYTAAEVAEQTGHLLFSPTSKGHYTKSSNYVLSIFLEE